MKKIKYDDNGYASILMLLENPVGMTVVAFLIGTLVIALTAVNPGIAILGLILCILGFGGIATMYIPKIGTVTFSGGMLLLLIGYGYIF
ncbi:MAG: hypothetical protein KKH41_08605 [Candidatus Thermoplasmatota archaeon]|nr:hypothetical protein [Euryarchaeota archaeon]MBU4031201.1 hypothetical protein [Candidatus Thermoplasmatota archaeon]MBU4070607.1 hypothetical protein [Candidatus Thermoplasmatota archaeon]MBU4143434.1 hypothetical protein [Candidatus Thermoplasmatota archaeon]MBU4592624.1 hypothetical protein [Candidatus Thermoplasmatota archaeon]